MWCISVWTLPVSVLCPQHTRSWPWALWNSPRSSPSQVHTRYSCATWGTSLVRLPLPAAFMGGRFENMFKCDFSGPALSWVATKDIKCVMFGDSEENTITFSGYILDCSVIYSTSPPLSLPVSYSGLCNQTGITCPPSMLSIKLAYFKTRAVSQILKRAVRLFFKLLPT